MSLNLQNFLASPLKEIDNIYFQEFDKLQNVSYDLDLTKNFESLFQNEEVYKQVIIKYSYFPDDFMIKY